MLSKSKNNHIYMLFGAVEVNIGGLFVGNWCYGPRWNDSAEVEDVETGPDGRGRDTSETSQGKLPMFSNLNLPQAHLLDLLEYRPLGPMPRLAASVVPGWEKRKNSHVSPLLLTQKLL